MIIKIGSLTTNQVEIILNEYDTYFSPTLGSRLNITEYSLKLSDKSLFAYFRNQQDGRIKGFVSFYCNDYSDYGYISLVGVNRKYQNLGLGTKLIQATINYCKENCKKGIRLEMDSNNKPLLNYYLKLDFRLEQEFVDSASNQVKYYLIKQLNETL